MKKLYKHIHMEVVEEKPKTTIWVVMHNDSNDDLGEIKWYPQWRQYCFFPNYDTLYSKGCLEDIADFIDQLMQARKAKPSNKEG